MLAPMRPRPIIPSCIEGLLSICAGLAASRRPFEPAIAPNQGIGGAVVMTLGLLGALELRDDLLREGLAQLHAPLIEGVDAPDRALGEDTVLIERNQLAQGGGSECFQEQRVRWPITLELS